MKQGYEKYRAFEPIHLPDLSLIHISLGAIACGACVPLAGFSHALRAFKVEAFLKKSFTKKLYAASRVSSPKNCLYQIKKVYTVHTRRLLSALPFLWSSKSFTSLSVWKNFWAFSPKNSSLTTL